MASILLEIITPQRKAFAEMITAVSVPTSNGIIGILPKHIGLFTALTEGEVKITVSGKEWYLAIGGGFMEVTKEKISILVSRAVHADEINEAEIRNAEKEAKEIISQKRKTEERTVALEALRRSYLDLKVLRHHKHRQFPSVS